MYILILLASLFPFGQLGEVDVYTVYGVNHFFRGHFFFCVFSNNHFEPSRSKAEVYKHVERKAVANKINQSINK